MSEPKQRGKTKYIVNEEKRSVIAFRTNVNNDVIKKFFRSSSNSPNYDFIKCLLLPDKLSAEAKCHPDDVWDVEVGKHIARERLSRMYRKLAANACTKYLEKISRHIEFVNELKNKYRER